MDDVADIASTAGQILHVLRRTGEAMNSHQIYSAGSFDYQHTCYNGLAQLTKKGVLDRDKVNGMYHYKIAAGADLSDYEEELRELDENGLPEPDPARRVGLSREEYTTLPKEEKQALRRTRSAVFRETVFTEVEEPAPKPALEIPQFTDAKALPATIQPPAPVVAAPPMLAVAQTAKPYENLLAEAVERRDAANREIALIQMMGDITSSDGGWLAFALQDYCELLKLSYDCMDDDLAAPMIENERRAKDYLANLKAGDKSAFRRAAYQLLQWAFLNEDAHAGCTDDSAKDAMKDAAESRRLAALFGVASKEGDEPKEDA